MAARIRIRRRVLVAGLVTVGTSLPTPTRLVALGPPDVNYDWVCIGGDWSAAWQGLCFANQPGASAVWHFAGPDWTTTRRSQIQAGAARWDQTNGHEFNYIEDTYPGDGSSGFPVYWTSAQICGLASAVGCTHYAGAGTSSFIVTQMSYRNPTYVTHTAAHEFGHALGLGHGGGVNSVMRHSSATNLSADDTEARCHIYGHSMGLWGGCPCPK